MLSSFSSYALLSSVIRPWLAAAETWFERSSTYPAPGNGVKHARPRLTARPRAPKLLHRPAFRPCRSRSPQVQMRLRPYRRALAASAALLLLAACDDGPTGPTSYVQQAAGGVWVAVAEPAALPRVETWLPYVGEGQASATLRDMRDRAARARSAGRVEEAMALEDEMMRVAAASLARTPEPARLLAAAAARDQWVERARARVALGSYPELAASTVLVAAGADAARGALARGEAAGAVQHLTRGTLAAREHAPVAVGLRL